MYYSFLQTPNQIEDFVNNFFACGGSGHNSNDPYEVMCIWQARDMDVLLCVELTFVDVLFCVELTFVVNLIDAMDFLLTVMHSDVFVVYCERFVSSCGGLCWIY